MNKIKVGDTVLGGKLVVVSVDPTYHVFVVHPAVLVDPNTGAEFSIAFDVNKSVEEVTALLQ